MADNVCPVRDDGQEDAIRRRERRNASSTPQRRNPPRDMRPSPTRGLARACHVEAARYMESWVANAPSNRRFTEAEKPEAVLDQAGPGTGLIVRRHRSSPDGGATWARNVLGDEDVIGVLHG